MWLERIADGVLIVDGSGTIVFANERIGSLLGYAPGELLGAPLEQLLPPDARAVHQQARATYQAHPTLREMGGGLDIKGLRRDGTTIDLDVHLHPVGGTGVTVASVRRQARHTRSRRDEVVVQREREGRAMLDLVVQRLYGIALQLEVAATSGSASAAVTARSSQLIHETIELIRFESLEPGGSGSDFAAIQSRWLGTGESPDRDRPRACE